MVEPTRRRRETKQETREALIAAALAEFAEHGLDAPSLDAICARAGYTRGAFYVHFRDRADLLAAVVEHAMTVFMDLVIATGDTGHDLEHTIDRFTAAVVRTIEPGGNRTGTTLPLPAGVAFARVLEGVTRDPRLKSGFTALLGAAAARLATVTKEGQAAGAIRAEADPEQVGGVLVLVALGVMVALDVGLPIAPLALRDTVLRLLARDVSSGSDS